MGSTLASAAEPGLLSPLSVSAIASRMKPLGAYSVSLPASARSFFFLFWRYFCWPRHWMPPQRLPSRLLAMFASTALILSAMLETEPVSDKELPPLMLLAACAWRWAT